VTTLYLDASVVLRILFDEAGVRAPIGAGVVAASSTLVEVETFRALDRARLTGHLDDAETARKHKELGGLLARMHLLTVSSDVVRLARATFPISVRALDALHVASGQVLQAKVGALEFWTHDSRQAQAALSRGLEVRGCH
jgi:uncharacterized protein